VKFTALGLLGVAILLQIGRDRVYAQGSPVEQHVLYVRSPEAVKRLVLGFDSLAADVYWIRSIQHYGRQRLSRTPGDRDYVILYPLLDLTTSLDPHFDIAYRFGAIFLSEPQPGGPGRPDLAEALLRKGIAAQPGKWQFYHDIGFIHYWTYGDGRTAAEWFRRAATLPGAPNWLEPVAASMLTEGADRGSAREIWQRLAGSEQEWLRRRAELALAQLRAMDQIDELERALAKTTGPPYTWRSILRPGFVAVDPGGTPYELDPATGRISVSRSSSLFPMPRRHTR
jgi:hypothetical protein